MKVLSHFSLEKLSNFAFNHCEFEKQCTYLQALEFAVEIKDFSRILSRLPDIWERLLLLIHESKHIGMTIAENGTGRLVNVTKDAIIQRYAFGIVVKIILHLGKNQIGRFLQSGIFQNLIELA